MIKAKVAALRTRPETVIQDYSKLCRLAGIKEGLTASSQTILKDNITWHHVYPAVNTTPWQLEGTILSLKENGFNDLVAVHNHTVVTMPERGEKQLKFSPIYRRHDIPVLYNFVDDDTKWVTYKPRFSTLALHRVFPEGIRIPDFFPGKNIVHLPTLKTHSYTTYTGALKNAFGGLLNYHRHYTHTWIHETLVDLLAIGREIHSGMFATMDGTTAGSGPGPRTVHPVDKDIILASTDQVAIDTVAVKLMGFDPTKIPCIQLADRYGLGCGRPENIELVGEEDIARERWNFKVGVNLATGAGRLLWHDTPLKHLQKFFFHTPFVNLFIFASEFYHDRIWYNLKGKAAVKEWQNESKWGRLFSELPE